MHVKADAPWNPESYSSFWINHASRLLMRQFDEELRPLGFGMAYTPVVLALEERGALLQKDLAELARVEQPTMAALLARMERDELIVREPHPTDRRATNISLTKAAKARLPEAKKRLRDVAERLTSDFSDEERATLLALLKRAVKNLGEDLEADGADRPPPPPVSSKPRAARRRP